MTDIKTIADVLDTSKGERHLKTGFRTIPSGIPSLLAAMTYGKELKAANIDLGNIGGFVGRFENNDQSPVELWVVMLPDGSPDRVDFDPSIKLTKVY